MSKIIFRPQVIKKAFMKFKSPLDPMTSLALTKKMRHELLFYLSYSQLFYDSDIFPKSWKKIDRGTPIPKKGEPSQIINYRPNAITSVFSKIMEIVLANMSSIT